MRSLRLARKAFAAEAAILTNVPDVLHPLTCPYERILVAGKKMDAFHNARGILNRVELAYELFLYLIPYLHMIHSDFIHTIEKKCSELTMKCEEHLQKVHYTNEECLQFLRLSELCKATQKLCERMLKNSP